MRARAPSVDLEKELPRVKKILSPTPEKWTPSPKHHAPPSSDWTSQLKYIIAATVMMTMQPLLVKLSQTNGKTHYSVFFSTFLSGNYLFFDFRVSYLPHQLVESAKLAVSVILSMGSQGERNMKDVFFYAVPALVYFINNNLVFIILENVDRWACT
jgi:hypothetical protein